MTRVETQRPSISSHPKSCHFDNQPAGPRFEVGMSKLEGAKITPAPPLFLPAPNARSSECAVYSSVLVVLDVVEVNVIMGAGMGSFVLEAVVANVIIGLGMHGVVCFAVKSSNLAVLELSMWML